MLHPFVAAAAFVLVEASVIAVSLAAGSALGGRRGLNMITRSMRTAELAEAQQETTQKPEEEQRQQQDHAQELRQVAQVQEEKFPTGRVETTLKYTYFRLPLLIALYFRAPVMFVISVRFHLSLQ